MAEEERPWLATSSFVPHIIEANDDGDDVPEYAKANRRRLARRHESEQAMQLDEATAAVRIQRAFRSSFYARKGFNYFATNRSDSDDEGTTTPSSLLPPKRVDSTAE
eukprot:SAG11_NODE_18034_length_501_cov_4.840796_1_plen_106_part_01